MVVDGWLDCNPLTRRRRRRRRIRVIIAFVVTFCQSPRLCVFNAAPNAAVGALPVDRDGRHCDEELTAS
jgi:hypothetical protein